MLSYYQITTKKIALAIQIILLKISLLSGNFCFLLLYMYFTNSVDQDQPGPDLDPNYWYCCERIILRLFILKNASHKKFA